MNSREFHGVVFKKGFGDWNMITYHTKIALLKSLSKHLLHWKWGGGGGRGGKAEAPVPVNYKHLEVLYEYLWQREKSVHMIKYPAQNIKKTRASILSSLGS